MGSRIPDGRVWNKKDRRKCGRRQLKKSLGAFRAGKWGESADRFYEAAYFVCKIKLAKNIWEAWKK